MRLTSSKLKTWIAALLRTLLSEYVRDLALAPPVAKFRTRPGLAKLSHGVGPGRRSELRATGHVRSNGAGAVSPWLHPPQTFPSEDWMKPAHEFRTTQPLAPPPAPRWREVRISMVYEGGKLPPVVHEPTDAEVAAYAAASKALRPNQTMVLRRARDGRSSSLVITTEDEIINV
jgi:hypothetical protein